MINVLFAAGDGQFETYAPHLQHSFANRDLDVDLRSDFPPSQVDYIVYAPSSALQDFTPYIRCKGVLSLWAGVERIVGNHTLTQPLCRMVDVGLTDGMVEWVVGHTMHYHLELDRQIHNPNQEWDDTPPPLAKDRHVTILGLGELGAACGQALANLGFQVSGWSRTAKDIPNITCHSGNDGLNAALAAADTLVLLLPQTPQTENVINADTLEVLKPGAVILNPGRGTLIDDQALISALDRGQIRAATLDVFRVEPLPLDHAYWAHPKVTVTPHIASTTRPDTASQIIAENIDRRESDLPLLHTVDRLSGY